MYLFKDVSRFNQLAFPSIQSGFLDQPNKFLLKRSTKAVFKTDWVE